RMPGVRHSFFVTVHFNFEVTTFNFPDSHHFYVFLNFDVVWHRPCHVCHTEEGENYEDCDIIFGRLAFHRLPGAINSAMAADGILSKDEFTAGSYCHMKFPAID